MNKAQAQDCFDYVRQRLADEGITSTFDGIGNGGWDYNGIELASVIEDEPIELVNDWVIYKHYHYHNVQNSTHPNRLIGGTYKPIRSWVNGPQGPQLVETKCKTVDFEMIMNDPFKFVNIMIEQKNRLLQILPDLKRRAQEKALYNKNRLSLDALIESITWDELYATKTKDNTVYDFELNSNYHCKWCEFSNPSFKNSDFNMTYKTCRIGLYVIERKCLYVGSITKGLAVLWLESNFKIDNTLKDEQLKNVINFLGPLKDLL